MTTTTTATAPDDALLRAVTELRRALASVVLPLALPTSEASALAGRRLVDQLDDYVLPRLARLDAPLLVVVGGSTGAGKSTLVNSLIGADVSTAGVLRPTTRGPVLVHHRDDADAFGPARVLPGLSRSTGAATDPHGLLLVAHDSVPPGIALLDAPDIDSVVTANRDLAAQLLGAADLWLFLTTAARYADAVPWDLLAEASRRSAAVAVVLDRVPPEAADEIRADLARMLHDGGLGASPLFVVPESRLTAGRLPEAAVAPLRAWLQGLASDSEARAAVARATVGGILASYAERVPPVYAAVQEQEQATGELRESAVGAYARAVDEVDAALREGTLLRGEVLARWQDVVGVGDVLRGLQSGMSKLRDRVTTVVSGRPPAVAELAGALETGLVSLLRAEADGAAESVVGAWRSTPAGPALLAAADAPLDRSSDDFVPRAERLVRDWQGGVLELVRREGAGRRRAASFVSYGVNGVALAVMVAVFASTGGLTGGEVVVAGGASAVSHKVLEALLGDQAVRSLAAQARLDLRTRVEDLLAQESARFTGLVDALPTGTGPRELRAAADTVAAVVGQRR